MLLALNRICTRDSSRQSLSASQECEQYHELRTYHLDVDDQHNACKGCKASKVNTILLAITITIAEGQKRHCKGNEPMPKGLNRPLEEADYDISTTN